MYSKGTTVVLVVASVQCVSGTKQEQWYGLVANTADIVSTYNTAQVDDRP